jgi:hypothetical protein
LTDLEVYLLLDVPFFLVVYLAVLLIGRPPLRLALAALLGGLVMTVLNMLADWLAYEAHWWHYVLAGLILHLPLPFYLPDLLFYGGIGYLLLWYLWQRGWRRTTLLLLIAVPLLRTLFDYLRVLTQSGYVTWTSPWAGPLDGLQYLLGFCAGYLLFLGLSRNGSPVRR